MADAWREEGEARGNENRKMCYLVYIPLDLPACLPANYCHLQTCYLLIRFIP